MRNNQYTGRSNVLSTKSMVSSSHPLSSLEAISILKKGGNAIDAAIAASAVQAVVEPNSTGIGGDCFAIVSLNGKKPVSINGSGIAPKKANYEYFKSKKINKIELNSPHSVTIPGSVHAWYTMHQKFGKIDFSELFNTAEKYAREGFPVYEIVAKEWDKSYEKLIKIKSTKEIFIKNNKPFKFGEIHKNPKLANTLNSIKRNNIKDFYQGYIAEDIVNSLTALGGCHSLEDFSSQKTIVSDCIQKGYKQNIIYQCPPNGPGITVLLIMAILEKYNFEKIHPLSTERFHLQAEASKIASELRDESIGDLSFNDLDIKSILTNENIENLNKKIELNKCYKPKNFFTPAHPSTIYLSVVDKDLNAVSFINSICYAFGSGITSNKTGVLLHNRGVNFRLEENHPNCIEGHKRPLHTIIPGLVNNHEDQTILSYGVMGGQYQPVGHSHVLQNIFDFNMSIQESIDFPRAFNFANEYLFEKTIPKNILRELKNIGHQTNYTSETHGGGQAIYIDRKEGVLIGGSDFRKDGCSLGV